MNELLSLNEYLDILCAESGAWICIYDLSGLLSSEQTALEARHIYHSSDFCRAAKSTARGFRACLRCKTLSNSRAKAGKAPFDGLCVFGLYELALPLCDGEKVLAVIYVGGMTRSRGESEERLRRMCAACGADTDTLMSLLPPERGADIKKSAYGLAKAAESYLRLLMHRYDIVPHTGGVHFLTREMTLYANENFRGKVGLASVAARFSYSEKYAGRVFKRETGMSFARYVNEKRLEEAEKQLRESDKSILEIALDCGFENVTYFNRLFKRKHGIPPGKYR